MQNLDSLSQKYLLESQEILSNDGGYGIVYKIKDQLLIEKDFFFKELIKTTQFDENLNLPIDESKNVNKKDALLNKELSGLFTVILNKLIYLAGKKFI